MVAAKAAQRKNRMRQAILAVLNYESTYGEFPFGDNPQKRHVELGWRTSILPFLDGDDAYEVGNSLDMKKSPGEVPNSGFASNMPKFFGTDGKNSTIAFVRPEKVPKGFREIVDGSSNTICMVEFPQGVAWLENKDVTAAQVVEMVKNLKEGESRIAARYDGSILPLRAGMNIEELNSLLTPAGHD